MAPRLRLEPLAPAITPDSGVAVARALWSEMEWLSAAIDLRIRHYFAANGEACTLPAPPPLVPGTSRYADLAARVGAGPAERLVMALALAPLVAPHRLDVFFLRNEATNRGFTEFGGVKGVQHGGFLPTGETALFLLAGDDLGRRMDAVTLLDRCHPMCATGILEFAPAPAHEPLWSAAISFSGSFLRHLATGEEPIPEVGPSFPARRVTTRLTWDDLVLDPEALEEVTHLRTWARNRQTLLVEWRLERLMGPGFTALFYGAPGTGKTLTASLLGRDLGLETYCIDLSQVVSKYIGETEKNLARVFDEATRRGWLLFFDEADALFGKRTATTTAHDRYANQEVAYLLQRVEQHPGIVILATNLKANIDAAFARRFQAMVHFAPPDAHQRERIWSGATGPGVPLAPDVDLAALARDFEITGGQIVNALRHACLRAVGRGTPVVTMDDLTRGVRRERRHEGRQ